MVKRNEPRKLPREKVDTGGMRPDKKKQHRDKVARAAAMNTGGVPPKTTIK